MHQIGYIAQKEVKHILRDTRSLLIAILMPVLMTLLYGYAVNLDTKNIKLGVLDADKSSESRELASRFYNSGYFLKADAPPQISDPEKSLKAGQANAILVVRSGFAKALTDRSQFELGLLIDGADANMAAAAGSYSDLVLGRFLEDRLPLGFEVPGIVISQQILYNPDLKSSHFFVPGLIAVILMMISALLTSVTIAREKETGTLEQLLTAPVTPRQIIIGKVAPYIVLALLDGILVLLFAVVHFGVPFSGSALLLLLLGLIYVTAALSLGILISTLVNTQQQAMVGAQVLTVMPSVMLSGYIFEIRNMPVVLQYVSRIVPARYFIQIIRGIMLKGSGLGVLWHEAVFLIILAVVLLAVATKRFRLRVG